MITVYLSVTFDTENILLHFTTLSTAELHPEQLTLLSLYARHKQQSDSQK